MGRKYRLGRRFLYQKMIQVPSQFQIPIRVEYPPNNKTIFEEWFFKSAPPDGERIYLPIMWTSFYVNHKYGKDMNALRNLQIFIDDLDRSKKYYTVLQYDDGILNDISKLDIKVFGSGGGRIDYPIPLVTMPHPYKPEADKDIFCSFVGSITHPIRSRMLDAIPLEFKYGKDYYLAKTNHISSEFCSILSRSIFVLCPRGYGKTSFRICEALQYQAIPVYISDEFIIPGHKDFNEYGVLIHSDQINEIDDILKSISVDQIVSKQEAGKRIYEEMFTFEGCKQLILNNL